MKDQITDLAKDWITLGLTGLGISFAAHEYFGGMFLALASASLAWRLSPEADQRKFGMVILTAFIVSHLSALLVGRWAPDWPVQLVMAVTGFASRWMVQFAIRLLDRVSTRGDSLADRVIDKFIPDKKDKP